MIGVTALGGQPAAVATTRAVVPQMGAIQGIIQLRLCSQVEVVTGNELNGDTVNFTTAGTQALVGLKPLTRLALAIMVRGTLPAGFTAETLIDIIYQMIDLDVNQGPQLQHRIWGESMRVSKYSPGMGGVAAAIQLDPGNFEGTTFELISATLPTGGAPYSIDWCLIGTFGEGDSAIGI